MIYQLKGLIKSFLNQERTCAWYHPEGGHANLTEKAPFLQNVIWNLPYNLFTNFKTFFNSLYSGLSKEVYNYFLGQLLA